MAELTTSERLQPSLIDRLTDDAPEIERKAATSGVMSMRQLRMAVLRDLEWLLNANCRPMDDAIHEFPLAAKSVLNFGLPDVTGLTASGISHTQMESMVRAAILHFEPRITGASLGVRAVQSGLGEAGNAVGFEIAGELCPLPMPEALFVRTELDLETGRCEVREGE